MSLAFVRRTVVDVQLLFAGMPNRAVPSKSLEEPTHLFLRLYLRQEALELRTPCGRVIVSARRVRDPMLGVGWQEFAGAEIDHTVADAEQVWITVPSVVLYPQIALRDGERRIHAAKVPASSRHRPSRLLSSP